MKKNLIGIIMAAGIVLNSLGFAYAQPKQLQNKVNLEGQKSKAETENIGDFYSSPAIPEKYGFKILEKYGDIDESKYPMKKDGRMYVVGYSEVYGSEEDAREDSERNAEDAAIKIKGVKKAHLSAHPLEYETYRVEKNGKTGYAVESLNQITFLK